MEGEANGDCWGSDNEDDERLEHLEVQAQAAISHFV
jgi:hypothetical protein